MSRKRPKKRERVQQPDTEDDDDDDDDDTIGERLDTSTNSRTYDTYNKASNSISNASEKDRTYKTKKDSSTSAVPTIKVHTLSKQNNESKANKHAYHANGETASNHIKKTTLRIGSASTTLADNLTDTNSSSSDDQPLSQSSANSKKASKTFSGLMTPTTTASTMAITTKRKVEVLSKESGKIGVTIKTSPEVSPPNKLLCTNVSATPITVPIKTEPAPLSPETPASHPESNTPPEKPSTSSLPGNRAFFIAVQA